MRVYETTSVLLVPYEVTFLQMHSSIFYMSNVCPTQYIKYKNGVKCQHFFLSSNTRTDWNP